MELYPAKKASSITFMHRKPADANLQPEELQCLPSGGCKRGLTSLAPLGHLMKAAFNNQVM
jgi:hypothetical protein